MADSKTTALTELTTLSGDEQVYIVEDDDGTPASRRMTIENLASGLAGRTEFSGTYEALGATVAVASRGDGAGNYTTTSTSMVPLDAIDLPWLSIPDCEVGDIILGWLTAASYNSGANWNYLDIAVDQPVSADTTMGGGNARGLGKGGISGGEETDTVSGYFIVTEAGTHAVRPVWRASAGTATCRNDSVGIPFFSAMKVRSA